MRLTDTETFANYHRMNPEAFDKLLAMVGPLITRINIGEKSISEGQRLSLTLRYLASDDSMISFGRFGYRVGKSTTSVIIRETCQSLWDVLKGVVFPTPSISMWKKISTEFDEQWNFPHCLGAMDVLIQAFSKCGSIYRNYKHSHNVVLFAICDAQYKEHRYMWETAIYLEGAIICGGADLNLPSGNLRDDKDYPFVFIGNFH